MTDMMTEQDYLALKAALTAEREAHVVVLDRIKTSLMAEYNDTLEALECMMNEYRSNGGSSYILKDGLEDLARRIKKSHLTFELALRAQEEAAITT